VNIVIGFAIILNWIAFEKLVADWKMSRAYLAAHTDLRWKLVASDQSSMYTACE